MMPLRALGLCALCPAILLLALPAQAQGGGLTWEPVSGPYGGWAYALASAPGDGGVVAIASDWNHLYRSDDGGAGWERLDLDRGEFSSLFAAPNGDFWAPGTPLLRSTDGGLTWAEDGQGLPAGGATALDAAPDGTLYAATGSGLYRRTPSSSAWAPTGFTGPALSVAVSPSGPVLTSTNEPAGYDWFVVHRSTDGGDTWEPVVLLPEEYATVRAIAFLDDGAALAGGVAEPGGYATPPLFRSTDGGATWSALPELSGAPTVAFYPAPGVVYADTDTGSKRSLDGGLTWEPAGYRVFGVAAGPGGSVLLATWGFGVLRSDDGGGTWGDATEGFGNAAVGVLALGDGGRVYAASGAAHGAATGLFRSDDGGHTWERSPLPFTPYGAYALHLSAGGALLLAPVRERSFPGSPGGGLFRSTDGGETWEDVSPAVEGGRPLAVPFIGSGPGGDVWAVVGAGSGGRFVFRSGDGGQTWEERAAAPFSLRAFTVAPDGSLWAGSQQPGIRVARSTDGAGSWEVVLDESGVDVRAIAVTPSGAVVVSARGTDYRSPDFGATWESVDLNLGEIWHAVGVFVRTDAGVLFGGVSGPPAVIRSLDDGATWEPVAEGLPAGPYYDLDLALDAEGYLWSANGREGIYRTSQPVTVGAEPSLPPPVGLAVTAFPNPFERWTSVALTSEEAHRHVEVEVFDVVGRRVATLHAGPLGRGHHVLRLDGAALSAGVYFVRVRGDDGAVAARLVLAR